jgi:hypothetical protein
MVDPGLWRGQCISLHCRHWERLKESEAKAAIVVAFCVGNARWAVAKVVESTFFFSSQTNQAAQSERDVLMQNDCNT